MTPELLQAIMEKNKAKRLAGWTNSAVDVMLYRKLKNKLKTSIHEAMLHYLTDLLKSVGLTHTNLMIYGTVLMTSLVDLNLIRTAVVLNFL